MNKIFKIIFLVILFFFIKDKTISSISIKSIDNKIFLLKYEEGKKNLEKTEFANQKISLEEIYVIMLDMAYEKDKIYKPYEAKELEKKLKEKEEEIKKLNQKLYKKDERNKKINKIKTENENLNKKNLENNLQEKIRKKEKLKIEHQDFGKIEDNIAKKNNKKYTMMKNIGLLFLGAGLGKGLEKGVEYYFKN